MNFIKKLKKSLECIKPTSDGDKLKIFISKRPKFFGGGSSTFARLFKEKAIENGHKIVKTIDKADIAIVIAHLTEKKELLKARENGCCIIHRLDEHFEKNEKSDRKVKHEKIIELNKYTDITVFQSNFVYKNVFPIIQPKKYKIIHNGGDPDHFSPAKEIGSFIGHVTWGIDKKKRLDLLHKFIINHPDEQFLLVGRHEESKYNFNLPNVRCIGKIKPNKIQKYFRMMKMLYFPSENDPCPNTAIEAILCGIPVCYNSVGGTIELVNKQEINQKESCNNVECGLPLDKVEKMLKNIDYYRHNCTLRKDLFFDNVFNSYINAAKSILN
ncbi:MAG: glycosyltransferase family 4 protein [Desulfobacterales bacterium]|nr:glycosyltransferase family 4 protein [Desulfobacterales bacterium]